MPTVIRPISLKASRRLNVLSRLPQKSGRSQKPIPQRIATKIIAAASRRANSRASSEPSISRPDARVPVVRTDSMATGSTRAGGGGWPFRRANARAKTRRRMIHGSIRTAAIRMMPRKAGTAPGGSCAIACTSILAPATSITRVIGTPSRSTLSISTIRMAPRQAPAMRPRPPRMLAPPMITAAMTISSLPWPYWLCTPLSWAMFMRPARVAHRQQIAADRIGLVAPARAREHEAADDRDDGEHEDLVVEAETVRDAEREERILLLGGETDVH